MLSFTKLNTPTNLRLFQGKITWNRVSSATIYQIMVNDVPGDVTYSMEYILPENYLTGIYNIKVRALGNGVEFLDSDYTEAISGEKLQAPQNVRVTNGVLEWDAVVGAETYSVKINNQLFNIESTSFDNPPNYPPGNYDVGVCAVAVDGILSDTSQLINADRLNTPTNLRIENGIIKWDSVLNGTGYKLTVNEFIINKNDVLYNLSETPDYCPNILYYDCINHWRYFSY